MFRINLQEIPEDGRDWILNRRTGELNEVLKDLIGNREYEASFVIRPLSDSSFELKGRIKTQMAENCSRCGLDFNWPIQESFSELLLPAMDQPRNSHFAKANHISDVVDPGPSVAEYHGHHFEAGEYLHEIVALAIPTVPAPEVSPEGDCSLCKINVKSRDFGFAEPVSIQNNPFEILKQLKQ